jgi:hypothetical protein
VPHLVHHELLPDGGKKHLGHPQLNGHPLVLPGEGLGGVLVYRLYSDCDLPDATPDEKFLSRTCFSVCYITRHIAR